MTSLHGTKSLRIATYARVSSEDQAERGTIQNQLHYLRAQINLNSDALGWTAAGEYVDDGISGTIPLRDRPYGRQLLEDAAAGRFDVVFVYKLDRLGRNLKALLDAHDDLERAQVSIRSGTEPFDTRELMGRFVFQLLGSLAELERGTIIERMTLGTERSVRAGKWTNGPIPFGYDLDTENRLIPSARLVEGTGYTEAEIARLVFVRMADGSSTILVCRWLNEMGVPTHRRYGGGAIVTVGETWRPSRINTMLKNTVYKGVHTFKSKNGPIERDVEPLVSAEVWERANTQLARNKARSSRNTRHTYLLSGLIRCGIKGCEFGYSGTTTKNSRGQLWPSYRCSGQLGVVNPEIGRRCPGKQISAAWLENEVWQDCRRYILDPDDALAEAQAQLRQRLDEASRAEGERRRLTLALAAKDADKDRVMMLFRKGLATFEETERQINEIEAERAELRGLLDNYRVQQELAAAFEAQYTSAAFLLVQLQEQLAEVERTNDVGKKRQIIEGLVARIDIHTSATTASGRRKHAKAVITYTFGQPRTVGVTTTDNGGRIRGRGSATS